MLSWVVPCPAVYQLIILPGEPKDKGILSEGEEEKSIYHTILNMAAGLTNHVLTIEEIVKMVK
jgi:hypothetical protein